MITTIKTSFNDIEQARKSHLGSLPVFQDYYLELLCSQSEPHLILVSVQVAGYMLIAPDNRLVEFELNARYYQFASQILNSIIRLFKIKQIYCQSFDALLLSSCLENNFSHETIGLLYRDMAQNNDLSIPDISYRYANINDLPFLLSQDDEVFEPKELIRDFITKKNILFFEKNNQVLGCGFLTLTHPSWNYCDIGVWVNPQFRRQGIACHILTVLKKMCIENNDIPLCGCDVNNINSQKTLAKCGFASKHKLIVFKTTNI